MKKTLLRKVSQKQQAENLLRMVMKAELMKVCHGRCMECHELPDFRGLELVHKVSLARGGRTSKENCTILCAHCHSTKYHGIHEA